jgi:hypothetical protein
LRSGLAEPAKSGVRVVVGGAGDSTLYLSRPVTSLNVHCRVRSGFPHSRPLSANDRRKVSVALNGAVNLSGFAVKGLTHAGRTIPREEAFRLRSTGDGRGSRGPVTRAKAGAGRDDRQVASDDSAAPEFCL